MTKSITRIQLMCEILTYTENEVMVVDLSRESGASRRRVYRTLQTLVECGLIKQLYSQSGGRYRISPLGRHFLKEYNLFRTFTEKYGLPM